MGAPEITESFDNGRGIAVSECTGSAPPPRREPLRLPALALGILGLPSSEETPG